MDGITQKRKTAWRATKRFGIALLGFTFFTAAGITALTDTSSAKNAEPVPLSETLSPVLVTTKTQTHSVSEDIPLETEFVEITPVVESEPEPVTESLGEFILTAYCPCAKCCEEWSAEHPSNIGKDFTQRTASGTIPAAGRTISVDPSVIPFGTAVIIDGREYIAEDCGGAIKGNRIDVFFDEHWETSEFGRRTAEVFIKKD